MISSVNNRMSQYFPVTEVAPIICIDSTELVQEVKKHPVIYDSSVPREQVSVFAAWEMVNVVLLPNFPMMNSGDKFMIRKKLRNRWSWMRSTLRRDLSRNKIQCHIHLKWMQEMQFLIPIMLKKEKMQPARKQPQPRSSNSMSESSTMSTYNVVTSSTATYSTFTTRSRSSSPIYSEFFHDLQSVQNAPQVDSNNDAIIQTFITSFGSEDITSSTDLDKNFLFALLHVFRNIGPKEKSLLRKKFCTFFSQ